MTRLLVLLAATLFVVAFAYLTLDVIATHGLTFSTVVAAFVVLLLTVGVVGSLFDHLRRR